MSSFYGGKQGRTYHIVQRYNSVADMTAAFSQGGSYSEVNYGLYVIIDTILVNHDKSSPLNGLLYRRGFDYNDDPDLYRQPHKDDTYIDETDGSEKYVYYDVNENLKEELWNTAWDNWKEHPGAGAIYVGQIVGPQGLSPEAVVVEWDKIRENVPQGVKLDTKTHKIIPTSRTKGVELDGQNNPVTTTDDDGNDIWTGDAIKVASVTMRDTYENVIGVRLAFDIPMEIFEISAQSVDAYGDNPRSHYDSISEHSDDGINITAERDLLTGEWKYTNLIHEHSRSGIDAVNELGEPFPHPFYHNLDIAIPKGIHGQNVLLIKIETGALIGYRKTEDINIIEGKNYYIYNELNELYELVEEENLTEEDILNYYEKLPDDYEYYTYSIKNYDAASTGNITQHLGRWPYRVIDTIEPHFNRDKKIFTWPETLEDNNKIPKIGDLCKVYITITNENEELEQIHPDNIYYICVKVGENGVDFLNTLKPKPEGSLQDYELGFEYESGDTTWRVALISLNGSTDLLLVKYRSGEPTSIDFRNLDYLSVDNENGKMYAFYSNEDNPYYLTTVGGLKNVTIDDEEGIIFSYKDGRYDNFPIKQLLSIDYYKGIPLKGQDGEYRRDENGKLLFFVWDDLEKKYKESLELDSFLKIRYRGEEEPAESFFNRRLKNLYFKNDTLYSDHHLHAQYIGEGNTLIITHNPINSIYATERLGDNILILYSDPEARTLIDDKHKYIMPEWTDPNDPTKTHYDLVWYNLGSMGAQYHIQGEYTYIDLQTWLKDGFKDFSDLEIKTKTSDIVINNLKTYYIYVLNLNTGLYEFQEVSLPISSDLEEYYLISPKGDLKNRMGWLVTVTDKGGNKHIYAYDYENKEYNIGDTGEEFSSHWYEVMTIAETAINPNKTMVIDEVNGNKPSGLSENGFWFVLYHGHQHNP